VLSDLSGKAFDYVMSSYVFNVSMYMCMYNIKESCIAVYIVGPDIVHTNITYHILMLIIAFIYASVMVM
jgi:hypothetical protein